MPRKLFPLKPGHLNFKHSYKTVHGRVTTLDEAVDLLAKRAKDKAARAIRDEGVKRRASKAQLFVLAEGQAKLRSKKVKMPEFSIQKDRLTPG